MTEKKGFLGRLKKELFKTRQGPISGIKKILAQKAGSATLEELEETLILSDIGVHAAIKIISSLQKDLKKNVLKDPEATLEKLKESMVNLISKCKSNIVVKDDKPFVIMVVGVNGSGKTTTIGKLINRFVKEGKSVLVAAGDTFRAAAVEQLSEWCERSGAAMIRHKEGASPAAVVFDALKAAKTKNSDVLMIDTAGRLHTKHNLMEELKKMDRIIKREIPDAPHETLLVLDATTGQNAISQAKFFHETTPLTGFVLTKLDGTAKGGVVINIIDEMKLPVKLIGYGEKIEDLCEFDPVTFVDGLFASE